MKEISWEEGERRILKNPEVAKECERAEPEFQALRQLILLRKKYKISQQKLAELINSHQSHIARLETGEVSPSLKILKRYAHGLGYAVEFNFIPVKDCYGNYNYI
ncbi:MAG: helix-turn-helix transcriptional regulator [Actinobacteria bacterium]|nr:helix-turn-helix transcriptional regulator [Actinomycetota bacterium]